MKKKRKLVISLGQSQEKESFISQSSFNEREYVYDSLQSLSLRQLYYVMDILPDIFFHTYEDATGVHFANLACEYPARLMAYTKCVSQLHQAFGFLKTSDLSRISLYIERLTYKQRVTTDSDFLDNLLDKVLEECVSPNIDVYEKKK